jgi:hypothetical protein
MVGCVVVVGEPWRRIAAEEREELRKRRNKLIEARKEDPGIKFISYYFTVGRSLDGYSHHMLFEVDDALKVNEMDSAIHLGQWGPFEKYSFEVVFGNTETDELWKS